MAKFILFLYRVINFYLYYVVAACFLSLVPNINPNYPFFHVIFKYAGFYIFPPIFGISFSVMIVMIACALIAHGLEKLYIKKYMPKDAPIIVLSRDEFVKQLEKQMKSTEDILSEDLSEDIQEENNTEENKDKEDG